MWAEPAAPPGGRKGVLVLQSLRGLWLAGRGPWQIKSSPWHWAGSFWGEAQCSCPGRGFSQSSGADGDHHGRSQLSGQLGARCWGQPGLPRNLPGNRITVRIRVGTAPSVVPGLPWGNRLAPDNHGPLPVGSGTGRLARVVGRKVSVCWLSSCPDCLASCLLWAPLSPGGPQGERPPLPSPPFLSLAPGLPSGLPGAGRLLTWGPPHPSHPTSLPPHPFRTGARRGRPPGRVSRSAFQAWPPWGGRRWDRVGCGPSQWSLEKPLPPGTSQLAAAAPDSASSGLAAPHWGWRGPRAAGGCWAYPPRPGQATLPGRSSGWGALRPWHPPAWPPLAPTCPACVELCGGPASQAACWGCVSNSVFSLCSCCSKAMFSKSLDIAEAHPQFSKEDRYTPCPPIPRPPAPKTTVGLVAGLGPRRIRPSQLWRGNPPASWGRAWARQG